ncbi:hypothetical protein [Paucibacter sp. Y2R2-4]|uniref:hypothetical protein n=1 Tax=Paucibacter sp. Y2R2-4 TaxID=2893553 RepID=UPI0021E446D6|nr:hypothetical protein [Paucibacter sp. Y2R2-4]MCV2349593.1 hypothetical protein [Paucibacter sp. Y2R2-4]
MYLIAIAWGYVALMMALAEATSSQGSILGAIVTLFLYGILPISIVMYILGSGPRKAARKRAELAEQAAAMAQTAAPESGSQADSSHHAATAGLAPERKEP